MKAGAKESRRTLGREGESPIGVSGKEKNKQTRGTQVRRKDREITS